MLAFFAWSVVVPGPSTNALARTGASRFKMRHAGGAGGAIEVRPASGFARPAPVPASGASDAPAQGAAAAPAGAKGKKLSFEEWDRKTFLENRGIREANADIENHNTRCDARRRKLDAEIQRANNNLAGSVYAQSRATEMQALATECSGRLGELTNVRDRMEDELQRLREKERASK